MEDKQVIFLVGTQCAPELEEKFNTWYNGTHVPMLLESKLLDGVTRYQLAPITEGEYPKYIAVYEFKDTRTFEAWYSGPEVQAARNEMKKTWGDKGFEVKSRAVYVPIKTWHK